MTLSLRAKFMLWILALVAVIYLALGAALCAFNLHERREHPQEAKEELEELFIIYGLMAAVIPLAVGGAWGVTGQLLKPIRSMLRTARQIQQGELDLRIETPMAGDELGQLAVTLNEAFDNYRRVLERIDRFSLDAAHQLRNPLAALRTSGEVCLQRDRSAAEYQDVIGRMIDDARRLGHTVDQLLLLARLAREDLMDSFEPLDLAKLLQDLVQNLSPAFEAAAVRLQMRIGDGPFLMQGAPTLIEQAIANLLDNALRFTPAEGQVVLELRKLAPGRILLNVADSGPGLSPAARASDTLAEQVAGLARSKDGTGLGLLIVSNVARAHGGTVQAKVSEWGGACFSLELPTTD
jgi:signal transduction histidine kinase